MARPSPAAPLLPKKSPPFVVSPAAAELQVARREPFASEAEPPDERQRRRVLGLDVRLHAMEPELAERAPQDERHRRAHEPLPRVRLERVVAEIRRLERP